MRHTVLGISAFYHDSAAALLADGELLAAAQEERFTRQKHDASFPRNAIKYCLEATGLSLEEVSDIVFYEKPFLKFERLLETYVAFAPQGFRSFRMAMPLWLREKLFQKNLLGKMLNELSPKFVGGDRLLFTEHHHSHAASAFFPSPFREAVVLTLDGVGEWATGSVSVGRDADLEIVQEMHFPDSLGLLYSAFTYYTGFKVNSGEYKVMGLAPYGNPRFVQSILDNIIDLKDDGSFALDKSYFNYFVGLTMTSSKFHNLFGGPPRKPDQELLTQKHMDLAASIQVVAEEVMLRMSRAVRRQTGLKNLCLAGGVALNCVANGRILKEGIFENLWIQPAAGDAGGAVGAAFLAHHVHRGHPRRLDNRLDGMKGAYLGPSFADPDVRQRLSSVGARYHKLERKELLRRTVDALIDERAVGWFQGRMEFGPRALGNRSILGDPRSPRMQKMLNLKVKYRESFRPFAPAVLREEVAAWFDIDVDSPYMLLVANVKDAHCREMTVAERVLFGIDKLNVARSDIPAVTHVDYSARVQTVHQETNPTFHELLSAFHSRSGCPVLVNTSFNVRGEPIVCTPEDAFRCFMGTEIENLVVGDYWLEKSEQDPALKQDYKEAFELD